MVVRLFGQLAGVAIGAVLAGHLHHLRDVQRAAPGAGLLDLRLAGKSVGDDHGVHLGRSHCGQ